MLLFGVVATVVASDTARTVLQDVFAAGAVIAADHMWMLLATTVQPPLHCTRRTLTTRPPDPPNLMHVSLLPPRWRFQWCVAATL